jgi:DNA polymerase-1
MGVRPSQVRDYLALVGDSSDNVPGVASVGPKTASELLATYGSFDGVYAHKGEIKRAKLREALELHEADARLSRQLVTLEVDPELPWDAAQLAYGGAHEDELRRLFVELEFTRMVSQLKPPAPVARSFRFVTSIEEVSRLSASAQASKQLAIGLALTGEDPNRAEIVGLAVSTRAGEGVYVPVSHRYLGAPQQLRWSDVRAALAPALGDLSVTKIAHDLKTVEVALARAGAEIAGPVFDPMIASYLLDPEADHSLGAIARRELDLTLPELEAPPRRGQVVTPVDMLDVESATSAFSARPEASLALALRLAPRLDAEGLGSLWRDVEQPLSRVLVQMELAGVGVDIAVLAELSKRAEGEARALEMEAKRLAGRDFSVRSRDQLETILFDELKLPALKKTPKGGRSTDAEVLEELAEQHDLPRAVLEFREIDKLKGTYIDALPRFVNPKTGRIHTRFQQTVAATGRLSSTDPNLQNIPIRTKLGREIRGAFVAPKGHVLVSADYSQIELRVLAHLSQDAMLLEAYQKGDDIHALTASVVFGVARDAVTSDMRRQAKTINFGVIYGMGDAALARNLRIPKADAARFIEAYFTRYEGVTRFMNATVERARKGEAVTTLLGRRRFLPNLHSANRGLRMEAERVAKNTPIQGTAADILKLAMVELGRTPVVAGARMVLTVHDELVFEVPEALADAATPRIREAMEGVMKLDVPLLVEVGAGRDWLAAH